MSVSHGTYDDADPAEIKQAIEDAEVQYRLKVLADAIARADFDLAVMRALEADEPEE